MRSVVFALLLLPAASALAQSLEEIVVTSERRESPLLDNIGNLALLDENEIDSEAHAHIHELLLKAPGTWISRGSGQENLTAIRSPVLTGAGSCGAFLTLEDGVPTRPSGFCNVNQLFEIQSESAQSVELIRGPGNALYGSNALHGTINVRMPSPVDGAAPQASIELGANDFRRLRAAGVLDGRGLLDVVITDDGGFRDDTGYEQWKLHGKWSAAVFGGDLLAAVSLTDLDQETAGFILGEDAYKDDAVNRSNPNPEAFRRAESQRIYGIWTGSFGAAALDVRPFARRSDMVFLQHFLPGQPLEENGHESFGVNSALSIESERARTVVGLDVEWADVFLKETQDGPTQGSPFLQETRPAGKHYDYEVTSTSIAPYVQSFITLSDRWRLSLGLRAELTRYDYDNRMLDGNTRDDGTACGFGGCLYTRPADRKDRFDNVAPKLGLSYQPSDDVTAFATLSRGFRAPQMTELYRLQSGQLVSDLDSETIDAFEMGLRTVGDNWRGEVAVFLMAKKNSVLRDAEGFNISDGESEHRGIEFSLDGRLNDAWSFSLVGTYARHVYDFDLVAARGETLTSGNDVDTAPRWFGTATLKYAPVDRFSAAIQLHSIGRYFLDAENRFSYPGHELINLNADYALNARTSLSLRVRNIADAVIADRADYAFGNYRFFPGRGREVFVELSYRR